jgi:hypothetical protein
VVVAIEEVGVVWGVILLWLSPASALAHGLDNVGVVQVDDVAYLRHTCDRVGYVSHIFKFTITLLILD